MTEAEKKAIEKKVYRKLMDVRQAIQDGGEEIFLKVSATADEIKRGTFDPKAKAVAKKDEVLRRLGF